MPEASIDLASLFRVAEDPHTKQKRKRSESAKAKAAHMKIADYTEELEVVLPLSTLEWDKKREYGQI